MVTSIMAPSLMLLVVALTVGIATITADRDPLLVNTVQGKLKGSILKTYTGKDILSFRGVHYAESPSGSNRFKPPVPIKPWEGVRDATEDGILCTQPYIDNPAADPEDCLSLNVYTKTLRGDQPVMVFFHQGGFMTGAGFSKTQGPRYLLDKDIVLVTLNYRLGPLGFLSTEDGVIKGNNGMKDQVQALRWVKQNIARFGGNPDAVTIFGNSAGSASVMYHMVSPMSRGLFIRAIAQSGSLLGGWAINRNPVSLATRLAGLLGCEGKSSQQIYNCLKDIPAQKIQNATLEIKDFGLNVFSLFAPVIEKDFGHKEERFLTADPLHLLQTKQFAQVPLILGMTTDEIAFRGDLLLQFPELTQQFDQEFNRYAPVEFQYERSGPTSERISHALREFYFGKKHINNDTRKALGEAYADAHLIFSITQTAKILAEKSSAPVYFYLFDYSGRYNTRYFPGLRMYPEDKISTGFQAYADAHLIFSITQTAKLIAEKSSAQVYLYLFDYHGRYSGRYIPGTMTPSGVSHSDDLIYLLGNSLFLPEFNTTDPEAKVIGLMTSLWTNFAYTGNPNIKDSGVEWVKMTKDHNKYLRITDKLELEQGLPFPERMALWESLFPLSGPRQIFF